MRLIDADALKESMGEPPLNWNNLPEEIQEMFDWNNFTQLIDDAPTIEAEPVRHGQWILPDVCYEDIECSVCHAYMPLPISFDYRPTYKYCPMCGAKMDEVTT